MTSVSSSIRTLLFGQTWARNSATRHGLNSRTKEEVAIHRRPHPTEVACLLFKKRCTRHVNWRGHLAATERGLRWFGQRWSRPEPQRFHLGFKCGIGGLVQLKAYCKMRSRRGIGTEIRRRLSLQFVGASELRHAWHRTAFQAWRCTPLASTDYSSVAPVQQQDRHPNKRTHAI